MGNSRLRADHYVVADGKMPRHPYLAGKNDVTAELGTSRQPHLSAEESVFTYVTAVSYLHEVIHLGPAAQARDPDASPIDAGVGLDFDVVLDHHRSWLNNLAVGAVGLTGEAKSIAAYDRAVLQNHVIADLHVFAYHRVRVGEKAVSNFRPGVDHNKAFEHAIFAQNDTVFHNGKWPDGRIAPDAGARGDHSRRVNARCWPAGRVED